MSRRGRVPWLSWALLLLWVPGCWSLHGPTSVTGTVGGSVSVECQYEEKFRGTPKYWCKRPCVWSMVKTEGADREVRKGHVSIRDHPANLTFTVTLESLTEDDAGTYRCGIDSLGLPGYLLDHTFRVVLSVTPGELCTPLPQQQHQGCLKGLRLEWLRQESGQRLGANYEHLPPAQHCPVSPSRLQVLLSLLALLLLLLGGSSLLAWSMVRRRLKCESVPSQLGGEPHYANLELQMWPLREEPMHPRQPEVEYSTVVSVREEPHYSTVVFDFQSGGSEANSIRSQRTLDEETQYSVIKKT
uniref:Ig-like domain-containing protein n=1 Tax=Neovison vison TaxID=452646 RepID=A0A8C7EP00_NEOVI